MRHRSPSCCLKRRCPAAGRQKGQKILIAGKLAEKVNIGDGKGSSAVRPPYAVTPLEGIYRRAGEAAIFYDDGADLKRTAGKAKDADAVVIIAGLTCADEGSTWKPSAAAPTVSWAATGATCVCMKTTCA